ncbi:hypothetical protein S100390_v1c07940 [Spiroplasma sp. NBRC 100390]|uniref:MupG family TIM beta-alpha barrel fold protein n=1 Tax=unclassified Spiroplasma TaxID=2637901 RepID=UPI0008929E10|nr:MULTISPECIES: MupG family TIM beta-alpha barrel fold protein [unclassified Spiroplasma]AOX44130.1 hypothetical protein STU14_v1c07940 [Spiroplasma sp. TU-14]APE13600.1 hypothetical protein S100390_v1c07940 [Spiroplasma sp. NBRC 100390]
MLGISIYTNQGITVEKNKEYLQKASQAGFKTVFYSGHYFEKDHNDTDLKELIKYARKLGLYTILDISKPYFSYDLVKNYAPDALRLDFGFSTSEIINLIDNLQCDIQLNGSDNQLGDLSEIIEARGTKRLAISYNFYPKPYTGMDISEFIFRTKILQKYDVPIFVFLATLEYPRGPLFQGLPTIEKFRQVPPYVQLQWYRHFGVENCIISDTMINDSDLKFLVEINNSPELTIRLDYNNLPEQITALLKNKVYHIRNDANSQVLRFVESRGLHNNNANINTWNNHQLVVPRYSLLIDNYLYQRYNGEIYLTKTKLLLNEKTNLIINLKKEGVLIDLLEPSKALKFI